MSIDSQVSPAKRTVTYTMGCEEAQEILAWYRKAVQNEPPLVYVQTFMEPLYCIAEAREYGGR